jgi:hypothetical protein
MSIAANLLPSPAPPHKARPLPAWSECDILALIGGAIGPRFPIGSASRWHRHAGSLGEKRITECIAGVVHDAAGDDPLARRIAVAAADHAVRHPPAPLRHLIEAAFRAALAALAALAAGIGDAA